MRIGLPVRPYRGIRGTDSWGSGVFGASRDGGSRVHQGLDFVTVVGDAIHAPITGIVMGIGYAYEDANLGSISIRGKNEYDGWFVQLLYVMRIAGLGMASRVEVGDPIGQAQDVAGYWRSKKPGHVGDMQNHLHLRTSVPMDPAIFLPPGLQPGPGITT